MILDLTLKQPCLLETQHHLLPFLYLLHPARAKTRALAAPSGRGKIHSEKKKKKKQI